MTPANTAPLPAGKPLLAITHPGHELRVHHWMERMRPDVAVLTDGSGSQGVSRLASTTAILRRVGASPTMFYAPVTDKELYAAVMRGDADWGVRIVEGLTETLVTGGYDYVLGDAAEGVIMGHDVFRGLLDTAIRIAEQRRQQSIASYDYPLEGAPNTCHPALAAASITITLDDAAVDRKLAAAHAYPELADEVAAALSAHGRAAFAIERLRPTVTAAGLPAYEGKPRYEQHGEQQQAAGRFAEVTRHDQHVAPLLAEVRRRLQRRVLAGAEQPA